MDMDNRGHMHDGQQMESDHGHDAGHARHIEDYKRRFIICLPLTFPVLLFSETVQGFLGYSITIPYQKEVLLLFSAIIYFYGGLPFLKGSIEEIKSRRPEMMTLISTAITAAFFYSVATVFFIKGMDFFWELATLIDIMLIGHYLEARSVLGASRALDELVRIMPQNAHILKDGRLTDIPVSDLVAGDIVVVKPGEKVPSDGIIVSGESFLNESLLTGESKPAGKKTGEKVIGGSINSGGALSVRIEKTGEETYLAQVIKLVKTAQESKSKTQDVANKAASMLFYVAFTVSIITYVTWSLLKEPGIAIERAVTVLVIACPHALGLAIPLVVAISTALTAKSGILIRDRTAFEESRGINAVVFDKTGTLTKGKFGVTDVVSYIDQKELLGYTSGVEKYSEHIIAKALVEYADSQGIKAAEVTAFNALPGKGTYAKASGKEIYIGGPGLLRQMSIGIKDEKIIELQNAGKTVVFTVIDGKLAGAFALSDTIRTESYEAVKELKKAGIKVYMLTGDAPQAADWVSKELGIDEYFAQVLPDQKAEKIKLIKAKGMKVAMVGDGVNDAPALVTADVGIAIGAGTDVAIESADIVLVRNDPRDIPKIFELSGKTYSKMVQNLWWAAGYNIVAIPLAAGVLYGYGIVLTPAIGALLMSLSTVVVAINSQTLKSVQGSR
jgi:Cu2+-exporting ATPase